MNILLLEDTYVLRQQIAEYLSLIGHTVVQCPDGEAFFSLNDLYRFDLFILDLNVPHYNGLEILQFLRDEQIRVPKIVITANADITSMKDSFAQGCCEYIRKPFDLEELEIRINRFFEEDACILKLNDEFHFDKQNNQVLHNGKIVELTKLHKNIISYLLMHRGRACSQDEIIEHVSPDKLIEFSTLASHIKNIRKATSSELISTVRGEGYRIDLV